MGEHTKEPQYKALLDLRQQYGLGSLGLMSSQTWGEDPKRLTFLLARYKFVAKMLAGYKKVVEVGCADAFATRIVQQEVGSVTAIDFDSLFIEEARERIDTRWPLELRVHDMLAGPIEPRNFDAAYSLDVLEHIESRNEHRFLENLAASLKPHGVAIVGMPSLESQSYASVQSRQGHVNCKTASQLKAALEGHFRHVFIFSMNDEVVHTGFYEMAHYLLGLCCEQK